MPYREAFFEKFRDYKFYSLFDLNQKMRAFLDAFNKRVMKDRDLSHEQRFELEKQNLASLPAIGFEIYESKDAKVHPDCCIQLQKSFYSVLFQYVGQVVRTRIKTDFIEIYNQDNLQIAVHRRATKIGEVVSNQKHFPESLLQVQSYDVQKALSQSKAVGPKTHELVKKLVEGDRPLRYLRRIQGLRRDTG